MTEGLSTKYLPHKYILYNSLGRNIEKVEGRIFFNLKTGKKPKQFCPIIYKKKKIHKNMNSKTEIRKKIKEEKKVWK